MDTVVTKRNPFSLEPGLLEFMPLQRRVKSISIQNSSMVPLAFSTALSRIESPGTDDESLVSDSSMLASPKIFVLAPGAKRQLRVVSTSRTPDTEKVFHLNIRAVETHGDTIPSPETWNSEEKVERGSATVLILDIPSEPLAEVVTRRAENGVALMNSGNRSIGLERVQVCDGRKSAQCESVAAKRLYPGTEMQFEVPEDGYLEFLQVIGEEVQLNRIEGRGQ